MPFFLYFFSVRMPLWKWTKNFTFGICSVFLDFTWKGRN